MNGTLAKFSEAFAGMYVFLMISSIIGNLICLFGLTRKYHKRRFRDHFFISMVICDLLRISLTGPMEIRGLLQQGVTEEETLCIGFAFVMCLFEFTSVSHLLLVVLDRYICVCKPTLALKLYLQPTTIYRAILFSYMYGLFWSCMPLFGLGEYGFQIEQLQCGLKPKHDIGSKAYILMVLLIAYVLPVSIAIWCFVQVRKQTKTTNNAVVTTVSDETQDQKDLRQYFSKDRKQFQLILALILTFIFTWFVYDLTMFEEIYIAKEASVYAEIVTTFIGQSSALITPIIILIFYTDIQKTFLKFLGKQRKEHSVTKSRASTKVGPQIGPSSSENQTTAT